MKIIGVKQLYQKKYKFLDIPDEWRGILGDLTRGFTGLVFGGSGNGKTEFVLRLAKMLCHFGKVIWISYEQGHGADLQRAAIRNDMLHENGIFSLSDPNEKRKPGATFFEELVALLKRRNSPQFVVIDSLDYAGFTFEECYQLRQLFPGKGIIYIAHGKGELPRRQVCKDVGFDGMFTIRVRDYIAAVVKSRLGGIKDYIIWEDEARRRNPLYFEKAKQ